MITRVLFVVFLALASATFSQGAVAFTQSANQNPSAKRIQDQPSTTAPSPQPPINISVNVPEPDPQIAKSEAEDRAANLEIQQQIIYATIAIALITGLQMFFGALSWRTSAKSAQAADTSAKAAQASAEAANAQATIALAAKRVGDRQLEQMEESLKIARLNAEAASASSAAAEAQAKRTAAALEDSASAAKLHAVAAIRTVENMDRPWLGVSIRVLQQPRLTEGKPLAIHFRLVITNVGRSAAQHVMYKVAVVADETAVSDPMAEVTRVVNSIESKNVRGQVILPGGELVREFILETEPIANVSVRPTIFGGVRYTYGVAADGRGLPQPPHRTTTFGIRVVAKNNIGSSVHNGDGTQTWFWDPEVETSAKDFHHAD